MLRLIQKVECPPDQYRYKHRQDGWMDKCFDYGGLISRVREHCKLNEFPIVPEEEIQDQLCKLLPPGWCVQEDGSMPEWFLNSRITVDDALRGTKVLSSFVAEAIKGVFTGKSPLVEKSVAAERGAICATCPFAVNVAGCGPCVGLSDAIAEITGAETLPSDEMLGNKSCLICKCAARAQVWLPAELLVKGVTDEMMQQFPEGWCWKLKVLKEMKAS